MEDEVRENNFSQKKIKKVGEHYQKTPTFFWFWLATQIASQPIDSVTTISQIVLYGESSFTTCSGGAWITSNCILVI